MDDVERAVRVHGNKRAKHALLKELGGGKSVTAETLGAVKLEPDGHALLFGEEQALKDNTLEEAEPDAVRSLELEVPDSVVGGLLLHDPVLESIVTSVDDRFYVLLPKDAEVAIDVFAQAYGKQVEVLRIITLGHVD